MKRRSLLRIAGTVGTVLISGCSSNDIPEDDTNSDIAEGENDSEATGTEQAGFRSTTATPNPGLISISPEEMALSLRHLPGNGWEVTKDDNNSSNGKAVSDKYFQRDNTRGNTEIIATRVTRYETVSGAETAFEEIGYPQVVGGEPAESQDLEIGSESSWSEGTGAGDGGDIEAFSADVVRVRDANVAAYIGWLVEGTQDSTVVALDEIRSLAETMVENWR